MFARRCAIALKEIPFIVGAADFFAEWARWPQVGRVIGVRTAVRRLARLRLRPSRALSPPHMSYFEAESGFGRSAMEELDVAVRGKFGRLAQPPLPYLENGIAP